MPLPCRVTALDEERPQDSRRPYFSFEREGHHDRFAIPY
jgi:hypothetical protein